MLGQVAGPEVGSVTVATTTHTGFDPEYWAERCLKRIIHVADDSDSIIKQQAMEFRDEIRGVLVYYMKQAIKSDRTTLYNLYVKQGEKEMAEILRRL
jgi:adenylate kinase family enzyme